jgi:uncharacterized membrane protein YhhN
MKTIVLIIFISAFALIEVWAEHSVRRRIVYVVKPVTMLLIILLAVLRGMPGWNAYTIAIVAGLTASLIGDIFLMLPSDRFLPGLVSFLVAHLFYIGAFALRLPSPLEAWIAIPLLAYGCLVYMWLYPSLGPMKLPVAVYVLVILIMAWLAVACALAEGHRGAGFAAAGALAFVVSDSILAINRFRTRVPEAGALIMGSYLLAQLLISLSV